MAAALDDVVEYSLKIVNVRTVLSPKKTMVYEFEISGGGDVWKFKKRYSELFSAYSLMQKKGSQLPDNMPPFPPKRASENMDKAFLQDRRDMLEAYFAALVASPVARQNPLVRAVLQLEPSLRNGALDKSSADMELPIIRSGYVNLEKRSKRVQKWSKRWAVLNEDVLTFAKNPSETPKLMIRTVDVTSVAAFNSKKRGRGVLVQLESFEHRFVCDSDAEADAWLSAIVAVIHLHLSREAVLAAAEETSEAAAAEEAAGADDFDVVRHISGGKHRGVLNTLVAGRPLIKRRSALSARTFQNLGMADGDGNVAAGPSGSSGEAGGSGSSPLASGGAEPVAPPRGSTSTAQQEQQQQPSAADTAAGGEDGDDDGSDWAGDDDDYDTGTMVFTRSGTMKLAAVVKPSEAAADGDEPAFMRRIREAKEVRAWQAVQWKEKPEEELRGVLAELEDGLKGEIDSLVSLYELLRTEATAEAERRGLA